MTWKDLQRLVQAESAESSKKIFLANFKDSRGRCCFNHIIGLPRKDGIEKPMFEYERLLYNALERPGYLNSSPATPSVPPNTIAHISKLKHLWVKKDRLVLML